MPAVYDGPAAVLLSGLSLALLCWAIQQPVAPFSVSAGGGEVPAAHLVAVERAAEVAMRELGPRFAGLTPAPFRILLHAGADSLPAEVAARHHPGSPGMAFLDRGEVHLLWRQMRAEPGDGVGAVVKHEVVHVLLHQWAGPSGARIPRWFHEGLAQVLSGTKYLGAREEDLIWPALSRRLTPFHELAEAFPHRESGLQLAYAQSLSYVAFLERRYGLPKLLEAVRRVDPETSFVLALVIVTRDSPLAIEEAWRDYLVHGSGARWRVLLDWCFPFSMVLALPLLALAMMRRQRADQRARQRTERQEESSDGDEPAPGSGPDPQP